MGCASSAPQADGKADVLDAFMHRSDSVPQERLLGEMREQYARELFDVDVRDVYDFADKELGAGGFSTVHVVVHKKSGVSFALKEIDLSHFKESPGTMRMLKNEIDLMKKLNHPNIVRLQEVYQPQTEDKLYLVMDYFEGGSLLDRWRKNQPFSDEYTALIVKQLLHAVRYCHDMHVMHRDLKLDNIMFEEEGGDDIKVIDFGLSSSTALLEKQKEFVGTILYTAPEILKVQGHSHLVDIWSVGVIAYTCVVGTFPFFDANPDICGTKIKYSTHSYPPDRSEEISFLCKDFIDKCLANNPKKRLSADECLKHPWIQSCSTPGGGASRLQADSIAALQGFQRKTTFKRLALMIVAYGLEHSEMAALQHEFATADRDGKGSLCMEDFKRVLVANKPLRRSLSRGSSFSDTGSKSSQTTPSRQARSTTADDTTTVAVAPSSAAVAEAEIEAIFNSIDVNNTGVVNFTEFVAACIDEKKLKEKQVRMAFDRMDYKRQGRITAEDLKMYVGHNMDLAQAEEVLNEISSRKDGTVTYADFQGSMLRSMSVAKLRQENALASFRSQDGSTSLNGSRHSAAGGGGRLGSGGVLRSLSSFGGSDRSRQNSADSGNGRREEMEHQQVPSPTGVIEEEALGLDIDGEVEMVEEEGGGNEGDEGKEEDKDVQLERMLKGEMSETALHTLGHVAAIQDVSHQLSEGAKVDIDKGQQVGTELSLPAG